MGLASISIPNSGDFIYTYRIDDMVVLVQF